MEAERSAATCLRCGQRAVAAHGGGFKCRACGAEEPSAAKVYIVTRWLYPEEGEGFDIEGVFASEDAAQAFIDSEPIPGKRYRILEQEVRDA